MFESEVATIPVLFHLGGYRCLKHFYLQYICKHMNNDFPKNSVLHPFYRTSGKSIITANLLS